MINRQTQRVLEDVLKRYAVSWKNVKGFSDLQLKSDEHAYDFIDDVCRDEKAKLKYRAFYDKLKEQK